MSSERRNPVQQRHLSTPLRRHGPVACERQRAISLCPRQHPRNALLHFSHRHLTRHRCHFPFQPAPPQAADPLTARVHISNSTHRHYANGYPLNRTDSSAEKTLRHEEALFLTIEYIRDQNTTRPRQPIQSVCIPQADYPLRTTDGPQTTSFKPQHNAKKKIDHPPPSFLPLLPSPIRTAPPISYPDSPQYESSGSPTTTTSPSTSSLPPVNRRRYQCLSCGGSRA